MSGKKTGFKKGDQVIVPALSWATDLAPVIQLGLEPILCDCNLQDLSVDLDHLSILAEKYDPKAIILVSVLGLVPEMDKITDLCKTHDLILLEDVCEGLGSSYFGVNLGNWGDISCFSSYFGHHISTIEGGMLCTNNNDVYNMAKCLRSHGWDRDLDIDYQQRLRQQYDVSDFDALYKFYHAGFNIRPTDLQANIGISQLKKLPTVVNNRNSNYQQYLDLIQNDFWNPPRSSSEKYVSNFAFPIIHPNKLNIVQDLITHDISVRPLICGSLSSQPFWKKHNTKYKEPLPNATTIDSLGFYVPNNHQISELEIEQVCRIINKYM